MRVVLVSSPGAASAPHWSHAVAAELARWLELHGAAVEWLPVVRTGQQVAVNAIAMPRPPRVARVAADNRMLPVELALTRSLRATPAHAVVHVGAGARGSPNIGWLAERMGSTAFAVARASEVVCHRGDLVHGSGAACEDFLDAARCARCCTASWWSKARAGDFRSRTDLLGASLLASAAVFVPSRDDAARLVAFGVPERSIVVTTDVAAIGARVLAG